MTVTVNDRVAVAVRAMRATDPAPARAFLATRKAPTVLAVIVLCGSITAWLGGYETSLPSVTTSDPSAVPLWRMLVVAVAVVPLVPISGPAHLEQVTTRRLRRYQNLYLGVFCPGCVIVYLCISWITLSSSTLMVMARSWLAWYGLSLLAGVVFGWRLSWLLPVAAACVLWYWGQAEHAQYRWWEFSARPGDDVPSFLLSVALLAAGTAVYWATPWRRRGLMVWRRGGK